MNGAPDRDGHLSSLMAAVQAGDRRAYLTLLRESDPIIRRVATRVGLPPDRADDVVQETMITLHNARQTYDPGRSFTAWLTVLARRRAIDLLRRVAREKRREVHAPVQYEAHPAPAERQAFDGSAIRSAVGTLSASQRQAVEHLMLQEQSLKEAADTTGRSVGALKVNLHRALKVLRQRLTREGDPLV